jgi:methionyl aminopeptidase
MLSAPARSATVDRGRRAATGSAAAWQAAALRAKDAEPIALRSATEIQAIGRAGAVVGAALNAASVLCEPGVTTAELDAAAAAVLRCAGAVSLFLNYPNRSAEFGFPASTCVSVNEEIVHGIPGERVLRGGDIVTIDCGARLDGWCADAAITVCIGHTAPVIRELADTAEGVLEAAIAMIRPGVSWSEIAAHMQLIAEDAGFGVVRRYVGHGIGRDMHEAPQVPAFLSDAFARRGDFTLQPGMVLAIEPMLTIGSSETAVLDDGWTVVTADGLPACHVEHTVAVTYRGGQVMTRPRAAVREPAAFPA